MMARRRRWLVTGLGGLAGLAGLMAVPTAAAAPDNLDERTVHKVRQVVEAQLRAMADGDGDKAFFYAAPTVRAQFGDAGRFMAMVLGGTGLSLQGQEKIERSC